MANNWTREELIITFNLYCKIPFSKSVKGNPDVINVANLIGRTPSAVAFKLGNFGSFDPDLKRRGIGGLPNASRLDKEIWEEFNRNWDELAFESESLIAKIGKKPIDEIVNLEISTRPQGHNRLGLVKQRVNQSFFRTAVLAIYDRKCCITGLSDTALLVASHIVPWSKDESNRTNPQNGLCLNALHDRAFDCGLITIRTDYTVQVSSRLRTRLDNTFQNDVFLKIDNERISLPDKFRPDKRFLEFHNNEVFCD